MIDKNYKKEKEILDNLVNSKGQKILVSKTDNKILCENVKPIIDVDGKKYKILSTLKRDKYELSLERF